MTSEEKAKCLRLRTGEDLITCKRALKLHNFDFEKALKYLLDEVWRFRI